jgi:serine/threonine protein kinase
VCLPPTIHPACTFASWLQVNDFNLSKVMEEGASHLSTTGGATNPGWLAPEIFAGEPATAASDVFSFGVVMWEVLTWQIPWSDANPWAVRGPHCAGCFEKRVVGLLAWCGLSAWRIS